MTACEIYAQGNAGETFFNAIKNRLAILFTNQQEPDDFEECPDKFEPMQHEKLPQLHTVSDIQIEAVMREAKNCDGVFASGMFRALELLGLPS